MKKDGPCSRLVLTQRSRRQRHSSMRGVLSAQITAIPIQVNVNLCYPRAVELGCNEAGIDVLMCSASYFTWSSEKSRSSLSACVRQPCSGSLEDCDGENLERKSRT
jgi:hypothetical protein